MTDPDKCPTCASPVAHLARDDCHDPWHRTVKSAPTPVRLLVVTNCGEGFALRPREMFVVDDVSPGGTYVTDCIPQQAVEIHEILVHDFTLVRISLDEKTIEALPVSTETSRRYRLEPALLVPARGRVLLHLMNDGDAPKKPKIAVLVADHHDPATVAGRRVPRDWDVEPSAQVAKTPLPASAPNSQAHVKEAQTCFKSVVRCADDRLDLPREPGCHAPRLTRTLCDGPGNITRVHGCSCGTEVTSAEAFAEHVDWPAAAVRALLSLAGITRALLDDCAEMKREVVIRQIARCLEVRTERLDGTTPQ